MQAMWMVESWDWSESLPVRTRFLCSSPELCFASWSRVVCWRTVPGISVECDHSRAETRGLAHFDSQGRIEMHSGIVRIQMAEAFDHTGSRLARLVLHHPWHQRRRPHTFNRFCRQGAQALEGFPQYTMSSQVCASCLQPGLFWPPLHETQWVCGFIVELELHSLVFQVVLILCEWQSDIHKASSVCPLSNMTKEVTRGGFCISPTTMVTKFQAPTLS